MRIILYVGEHGWDWLTSVDPDKHSDANEIAEWLVTQALKRYGNVEVVRRGVYGHEINCYEKNGTPDPKLEESLKEIVNEILGLFLENQGFWLSVPLPWEPYFSCDYDAFLRLENAGEIRIVEPRNDEAAQGLYALTDLTEESWVGEVAEVSSEVFPGVSVGDYIVCDGIGAAVRFYHVD